MNSRRSDVLLGEDSFPVGRLGAQYERTFRILTYLLAAWCENSGNRDEDDKRTYFSKQCEGLSIIAFDKLAVFSYRIWNQLWELNKKDENTKSIAGDERNEDEDEQSKENDTIEKGITFPYPFREIPGKHGRGLAIYDWHPVTKRPGYLPEILLMMARDKTQKYLRFQFSGGKEAKGKAEIPEKSYHKILVTPGLEALPTLDRLLQRMGQYEQEVLRDLQGALKRLNNHEVRVIGTHSQRHKTIEDIKLLLSKWRELRQDVVSSFGGGELSSTVEEMVWHADEMWRKAVDNADVYKKATHKIYKDFTHDDVKRAFKLTHSKASEIWSGDEIKALQEKANEAKEISAQAQNILRNGGNVHQVLKSALDL